MLRVDLGDPTTLWLNITNLALGVATALCLIIVAGGAVVELWGLRRGRLKPRKGNPNELWWAKRQFKGSALPSTPHDW